MSKIIMDKEAIRRSLIRITHEIIERNSDITEMKIVGIRRRGASIADVLADNIHDFTGFRPEVGYLDITFYRDDLTKNVPAPELTDTSIPFDVDGAKIILVDDVIFTGRTCRAAIEALFALGRPLLIQFAVLVDRGHRELPFRPDYIGKNIPTSRDEKVSVCVMEYDNESCVKLDNISDQ